MKRKTPTKKSGSGGHLTLDSRSGMSDPSAFPREWQKIRGSTDGHVGTQVVDGGVLGCADRNVCTTLVWC